MHALNDQQISSCSFANEYIGRTWINLRLIGIQKPNADSKNCPSNNHKAGRCELITAVLKFKRTCCITKAGKCSHKSSRLGQSDVSVQIVDASVYQMEIWGAGSTRSHY